MNKKLSNIKNYKFRQVTWEDFDFIFELKKQCFKWYVDILWGWNDDDQRQRLKKEFDNHITHMKVITLENKDIGLYEAYITPIGDMFISEISLLKEYQNMGIGTSILTEQLEKNKEQNITTTLQVFKENKAKELYEKLGFVIYNETDTHYQMKKIYNNR